MAHLAISLLGTFQVNLDGHPQSAFETDKTRALLAYLAVESGRPHRREALAAMLWPDCSDSAARNSLRQTLFRLRQAIADQKNSVPYLLVSVQDVQFNPAAERWLDVDEFDRLYDACRAHHPKQNTLCHSCRTRLEAIVGLYQGNFLAGFSLTDCPEFETWQLLRQESYHRHALDALEWLGNHFEQIKDFGQAASMAKREIELAPWHEAAHRRAMRALASGGRRQAALRQFYACREILDEELGVAPVAETLKLFEAIRDGEIGQFSKLQTKTNENDTVSLPERDSISLHQPPFSSFVNFSNEIAKFNNHLDAVLSGQGKVIFVVGEGGSGKSTLIGEFISKVLRNRDDVLVAAGQCDAQFGLGVSFQPFCEILRTFGDDPIKGARLHLMCPGRISSEEYGKRMSAAMPAFIQALVEEGPNLIGVLLSGASLASRVKSIANLDSDLQKQFDEILTHQEAAPFRPGTDQKMVNGIAAPATDQSVLLDQLTRVFQSISEQFPMILILDDLHWADVETISLLLHLGRQLADFRLLIIGAYRPAAIMPAHSGDNRLLEPVVHELQRHFGDILINLDQVDGRGFIRALIDKEPNRLDSNFLRALYRHTVGNPLFTVELLRVLHDQGDLIKDSSGCWTASDTIDWALLPPQTAGILTERFSRLPSTFQAILSAASVQGQGFIAEVVARILGYDAGVVINCLSDLAGRRSNLVRAQSIEYVNGQRLSHYEFLHTSFQQYLYGELDDAKRHLLHESTGFALETIYAGKTNDLAKELAGHFQAAGVKDKARQYVLITGKTTQFQ